MGLHDVVTRHANWMERYVLDERIMIFGPNGLKAYGDKPAMIANCATEPHSPEEIIRIDPFDKSIPYKWELKHG